MRKLNLFLKRTADILVSAIALVVLTVIPVMLIIPLLIKLDSKGPALFTQDRVGKDGKIFKIYKFRTMLTPEQSLRPDGTQMHPKERITKIGRFLRKTSLDELAQLFNVFGGSMSVVGPRPMLPNQAKVLDEEQNRRHEMRPGITGWAQVNGRNELSWGEKIPLDLEYIEKFNIWFDIKILFKTVAVVLKKEGIQFKDGDTLLAKNAKPEEEKEKVNP